MRTAGDFVPEATSGNVTYLMIDALPPAVWGALTTVRLRDLPLTGLLLAIRSLPSSINRGPWDIPDSFNQPLIEAMINDRFVVLAREENEALTLGVVGRFWELRGGRDAAVDGPDSFVAFDAPGYVKTAIDFTLRQVDGQTRLTTETRNAPTDAAAARAFHRYWRVVGPGSKAIRLELLRAIRREALKRR